MAEVCKKIYQCGFLKCRFWKMAAILDFDIFGVLVIFSLFRHVESSGKVSVVGFWFVDKIC